MAQKVSSFACIEYVVPIIDGLRAAHERGHFTKWTILLSYYEMPVGEVSAVEEVWGQGSVQALDGVAVNVIVGEEAFIWRFVGSPGKPYDNNVNMGHTPRVAAPCKGAVGE